MTYSNCLSDLKSFHMLLNRLEAGQKKDERNLERKAGCLRYERTGGEEKRATNNTVADGQCCVEKRDEAEGTKGSRMGHCTGLLVIDVAAHTTSVHAWKNHRDSSGLSGVIRGQEEVQHKQERLQNISCIVGKNVMK